MKIPKKLPPNIDLVKSRIVRVETLPPNESLDIDPFGNANRYIETLKLDSNASAYLKLKSGKVIATREWSGAIYLGAMVDQDGLIAFYQKFNDLRYKTRKGNLQLQTHINLCSINLYPVKLAPLTPENARKHSKT